MAAGSTPAGATAGRVLVLVPPSSSTRLPTWAREVTYHLAGLRVARASVTSGRQDFGVELLPGPGPEHRDPVVLTGFCIGLLLRISTCCVHQFRRKAPGSGIGPVLLIHKAPHKCPVCG
jgi:hypothetical protein